MPLKSKQSKLGHGGFREGSGRPEKYGEPTEKIAAHVPASLRAAVDAAAAELEISRSEFIVQTLRNRLRRMRRR